MYEFNQDVEKIVLYHLIFENITLDLDIDDFIDFKNKEIFKNYQQLKSEKKEIQFIEIARRSTDYNIYLEYLSNLVDYQYAKIDYAYDMLKDLSKRRKLKQLKLNVEAKEIDIEIEKAIADLKEIQLNKKDEYKFSNAIWDSLIDIENKIMKKDNIKYLTHIFDYNKLTNGLHEEELTIIGARPGVGKTTFALELAYTIAKKGVYTAFLSLEMSSNQLIQKLLSNITGIDSNTIRTGNVEEEQLQTLVHVASNHLSSVPLYINNKCFNIQDIELIIRKLKNQNNLGLVVIDYLQLVRSKSKFANREQEVADVSRTLKLLALELKIPIVALCQLGRNAQRTKPTLADLRESGAIEQDADNVILLYKENEESLKFVEDVMLYLAKQRAGITGTIKIRFDKRKSKFNNIEG